MEWKEVRLGDVCNLIAGFAFKAKDFGEFPTKVIKIGDIKPPFVDYVGQVGVDISCYDINKLSKYTVRYGDYVLAMTGATIGKVGKYISEHPSYINQRVLKFAPKLDVDADYINYTICSNIFAKYVVNYIDSESAQPNISAPTISKFVFRIPKEKDDQRRIASILSSLDRKIELNNKINADLEEMAQAIFKNWFVDFEPFKDGKFVDSELGMIPEGWKVGTLGDITKNKSAKVKERNDVKVLSPVTTGELVLSEEYFTKQVFSSSIAKYKIVNKGDFAYNPARVNIGSLGRNEFDFDGCVSPVYVVFSVLDGYENYFDLFRKTDFFKDSVASLAIGGVRQSLSYDDLSLIETIIPSEKSLRSLIISTMR